MNEEKLWTEYMTRKKKIRSIYRQRRRVATGPRWLTFFGKIGIVLLLILAIPVVLILVFRWVPVPTSAFMLAHMMKGKKPVYQWVGYKKIAPTVPIAVVASEDQNFPYHWGFDFKAIGEAYGDRLRGESMRGASTISQQTAKNLFLWSGRTWLRKGLEAGLTLVIELCWPKQRILEVYLNIAQFGPNIFGIEEASRTYFHRSASRITARQAALLAAMLPDPRHYRISPPTAYMRQRAAHIQHQVRLLGGPSYLTSLPSNE